MSVRPGTRLDGRYRLSERLAYGGMGEVWRATDEVLSREVAVKILRPELAEDEAFVRRFRAEARTTSGLPHNGIAAVYDYGETRVGSDGASPAAHEDEDADPVAYLVMELVPGEALSSMLSRDGALSSDLTLDLVAQAARALHAAHQRGVIHRDIKPANLMVTPDGRVKVTDFGIARPLDHEPLTATGQVMGTAHYLAPELAKGQDASPLSDVYALGVVAYECLAGHRPFEGDNQVAVALAHLNEQPPPLPGSIPEQVRAVVGSAMEKEPNRRMPSAEAFAAALETLRFRQNGDDGASPATGVLPGSAVEEGLRAAGLLPPQQGWTPGLPNGRTSSPTGSAQDPSSTPMPMPPGTQLLGPAVGPRTGGMAGGFPQGHVAAPPGGLSGPVGAAYGQYGAPGDPFRTPTAPGGLSVTPGLRSRERNQSVAGPLLVLSGLAVVIVIALIVLYLSNVLPGGNSATVPGGLDPSPTTILPTSNEDESPTTPTTTTRTPTPRTRHTVQPPTASPTTIPSATPTATTSNSTGQPTTTPQPTTTTTPQPTTTTTPSTAPGESPTPRPTTPRPTRPTPPRPTPTPTSTTPTSPAD
jgi:serine/threonine protein kinase